MRNLYKPNRYNVASIQAQQTMGGDVMQSAEDGDYVEWRDYKRVLNEIELLNGTVKYWEIEANTDHARWLRVLEDYERLKEKSNCQAECLDAFDVKLSQAEAENARLKAEVERLTALVESNLNSSKVAMGKADAVLHERDSLKAEVERLRKAGDGMEEVIWLQGCVSGMEIKERAVKAWKQAKEGKPSV